jgi:hypothetical protein
MRKRKKDKKKKGKNARDITYDMFVDTYLWLLLRRMASVLLILIPRAFFYLYVPFFNVLCQ